MAIVNPGDRSLNNLLLGIVITGVVVVGVPGLFALMGWGGAPTGSGWWILVAACFALIAKLVASETATGEFEFYKFGYDNCVTTLGATITALAIQLYSSTDVFPGMGRMTFLPTFGKQGSSHHPLDSTHRVLCDDLAHDADYRAHLWRDQAQRGRRPG